MLVFWVACGGAMGAVLRYMMVQFIDQLIIHHFPFGSLVVNVIGSFLIGALAAVISTRVPISEELRHMLMVGVLASFTTFSSFSLETLNLMQMNQLFLAGINILAQVSCCLVATAGAWYLFRSV